MGDGKRNWYGLGRYEPVELGSEPTQGEATGLFALKSVQLSGLIIHHYLFLVALLWLSMKRSECLLKYLFALQRYSNTVVLLPTLIASTNGQDHSFNVYSFMCQISGTT